VVARTTLAVVRWLLKARTVAVGCGQVVRAEVVNHLQGRDHQQRVGLQHQLTQTLRLWTLIAVALLRPLLSGADRQLREA
jgi:hypothetical protein